MPNILTATQAANALRVPSDDPRILDLLPQVDLFVERATGRSWAQDAIKNQVAVMAATITLVLAYDNPAMMLPGADVPYGLSTTLAQLEAEALRYRKVTFAGNSSVGNVFVPGARIGDEVISLTGVYGLTGDQSAKFAGTVSDRDTLQQIVGEDLSENLFVVNLKNPADDL